MSDQFNNDLSRFGQSGSQIMMTSPHEKSNGQKNLMMTLDNHRLAESGKGLGRIDSAMVIKEPDSAMFKTPKSSIQRNGSIARINSQQKRHDGSSDIRQSQKSGTQKKSTVGSSALNLNATPTMVNEFESPTKSEYLIKWQSKKTNAELIKQKVVMEQIEKKEKIQESKGRKSQNKQDKRAKQERNQHLSQTEP